MNRHISYLFVINPVAGGKDKAPFYHLLDEQVADKGFSYEVMETSGAGDEQRLQKTLDRFHPQRTAAVGGDGTVQLVGKTLKDYPSIALGIIPYGSANGLATELNISPNPEESLQTFLESERELKMDIIRINDRYDCFHFADVGVNADLVKDFDRDRARGLFTYAKYLIRRLEDSRRQHFRIRIDGRTLERSGLMVALANASRLGTGVVLNRRGDIGDGFFEVVVVKELRLGDLLKAGLSTLQPDVDYGDAVECVSCRKAEVELPVPRNLQVDGELIGKVTYLKAQIKPAAVTVILPE